MPFPISFAYPWYLACLGAMAPVVWLWRRGRSPVRRASETVSLALRVLILGLLVLSLAGLQWVLDRLLEPTMVFADVGANQGEFTLFAAKRLTRGRVIAFEPMTEMRERLVQNIEANAFENVLVSGLGLWSAPGRRRLFRRKERFEDGSFHEGLGTLFPSEERSEVVEETLTREGDV